MFLPFIVFAQEDVFDIANYLINGSIITLIGVATIVFMYGVILYVIAKGDEKQLSSGKTYMLYGIIGLTAMVAVWGLVNLLIFTIFGTTDVATVPGIPGVPGLGRRVGGVYGDPCDGLGECVGEVVDDIVQIFQ